MGLLKNIKLYFSYRKIIKENRIKLESDFNIRIDNADRLYTVVNVPESIIGDNYDLKKSDIDRISEGYIREFLKKVSDYLNSIGLVELYDFYDPIKKVDKLSYLIVLGFKPLDSVTFNKVVYRFLVPFFIISIIITVLSLFL